MVKFKRTLPFDVLISGAANGGYVVRVGCCTMCYGQAKAEREALLRDLSQYLLQPIETIEAYENSSAYPLNVPSVAPPTTLGPPEQEQTPAGSGSGPMAAYARNE